MSCYFFFFFYLMDLSSSCGECMLFHCIFCVNGSLCLVGLRMFGETICNMVGCGCYFIVETMKLLLW